MNIDDIKNAEREIKEAIEFLEGGLIVKAHEKMKEALTSVRNAQEKPWGQQ
jgi:hypothetical protein